MPALVLMLLRLIATHWRAALWLIAAIAIGLFVLSWRERGRQIEAQQVTIAVQAANLETAKKQIAIDTDAENAAAEKLAAVRATNTETRRIIKDIHHAPAQADAPVAPVLRSALDNIGRLHQPSGHPGQAHRP